MGKKHTTVKLSLRDVTTLCVILSCVNQYSCTRTMQKNSEYLMRKFGKVRNDMLTNHKPFDTMEVQSKNTRKEKNEQMEKPTQAI